ncbi:hypothetical protein [uncultured Sphingomonas sp.]|uniref:hypothetical protein n=1 Tax=uncultured Sphingomonas sp. TaxID=158754 RepID=UPI0025D42109|nr:hypothetical protein [uncultured Sphingomonas sp.]
MAKDRKARAEARITVMALANMTAAIVDAMRDAEVPNHVVHTFLDRFDTLNDFALYGPPAKILGEMVALVRATVPDND